MKFLVVVALLATSQVTIAQFNTQQKKIPQEQSVAVKKPNAFLNAVKIPSILIGMGVYSCASDRVINRYEIREERNEHLPNFHTTADNYLMHAPIVAVYGLNMAGIKGKHDFKNRTLLLVKSEAIMFALTYSFKYSTNVTRPDGTDQKSFASGHTAQAFATATFMAKEYCRRQYMVCCRRLWHGNNCWSHENSQQSSLGFRCTCRCRHWNFIHQYRLPDASI